MAAVRHCRNVLLGLALLLAPALGMAQQAISPVVFSALTSAQQAQQQVDLAQARRRLDSALEHAPARSLELALIQPRPGFAATQARLLEQERRQAGLNLEQTQLLVQCYSRLREYRRAIPLAEEVVRANAAADDVWYQLLVGMSYEQGDHGRAAQWQKVLLKRDPARA